MRRTMVRTAVAAVAAAGVAAAGAGIVAVSTAGAAAAPVVASAAAKPKEGDVKGHRRILIVKYHTIKTCAVVANYPRDPGGRQWTVPAASTINWRYNVTKGSHGVAVVSDTRGPAKGFPWWGFVTDRSCVGTSVGQHGSFQIFHNGHWITKKISYPAGRPVPNRALSARSQFTPYWAPVRWKQSHGAVPSTRHRMAHNATLRDAPNNLVLGNVFAGWQVRPTPEHRGGMTKAYVPALHRWGWLQI